MSRVILCAKYILPKFFDSLSQLKDRYPTLLFKNQFGDPVLVERERKRLEVVVGKSLPDLRRHLVIAEPDRTKAKELLIKLVKEPLFEMIYPRMKSSFPGINSVPDLTGNQGYLDDLNIRAVWMRGITGQNTYIGDEEGKPNWKHEDFPATVHQCSMGDGPSTHATMVMGILIGLHNEHGIDGISPDSKTCIPPGGGEPDFIRKGASAWLVEEQTSNPGTWPSSALHCNNDDQTECVSLEFFPDSFESYQIATAMGVPVILPAGNGNINMDTTRYLTNEEGLRWPNLSRQDSGAIMVGASMGANHEKAPFGNCGRRVNLFAWGSGVVTTSYPGKGFDWYGPSNPNTGDPNVYYTNAFGGTSPAGAIIAGTVALLQSYAMRQMGSNYKQLTPEKIREILIQSGVPAEGENGCNIGKQPRMDAALNIFDDYWASIQRDFPEIASGTEIKGDRRRELRQRGVQLVCNYHHPEVSDVNCPETAKCVLRDTKEIETYLDQHAPGWRYGTPIPEEVDQYIRSLGYKVREVGPPQVELLLQDPTSCQGSIKPTCIDIDYTQSDYDCAAGAIWPTGIEIAKTLDFDGDQKADLVNWTKDRWQIDLSSKNDFGAWNLELGTSPIGGRWVWPVAEDYNSDGRTDLSIYDKENGIWYIKFTNNELLRTSNPGPRTTNWDWIIQLPYKDELNRDVKLAKYGRPVPGDYNGDGYIDLAVAKSDGIWSIDFGGPNHSDYGTFDLNVTYLTSAELAAAPGWAYLPVADAGGSTAAFISYKIPDGVPNAGQWWGVDLDGGNKGNYYEDALVDMPFGGNDSVPVSGDFYPASLGIKTSNSFWSLFDLSIYSIIQPQPNGVFGGPECHPFAADFDGDGKDDRVVQCPTEFRIAQSSDNSLRKIPLVYNTQEFSLPGRPYVGGISYETVKRLIEYQLINDPNQPPVIPVDMAQVR
ncbi:MAG: hypothetical protein A3F82_07885 [Deltaproteobacteria bacterium RIFCSPLOWO2_12_FULL_44_12]|nr:MAG: hypothetical protein A3D98_11080 [Deltaproteobacteria bacterium RIFCSPHIGHO2_12_FULL_44_21]OGQ43671.1 MAG: hypothetical protein A3I70_03635 [Deltaproteobacteria bacterium RIFCSPLOWO2_02_FULL_44_34]OGQ70114.1 MAG: hypothetical protein A3F82_07885 [Deltaproteobacteria bacterium RIFCSPLOWO2_12_FULL_44_12]